MGFLSELLGYGLPPFDIAGQESIFDVGNVKRRRQFEDELKSEFLAIGDNNERFLAEQYRDMIRVFKEQDMLLHKYIKLLIERGRFENKQLLEDFAERATYWRDCNLEP